MPIRFLLLSLQAVGLSFYPWCSKSHSSVSRDGLPTYCHPPLCLARLLCLEIPVFSSGKLSVSFVTISSPWFFSYGAMVSQILYHVDQSLGFLFFPHLILYLCYILFYLWGISLILSSKLSIAFFILAINFHFKNFSLFLHILLWLPTLVFCPQYILLSLRRL